MTEVALPDLVEYLDRYLKIRDIPDEANAVNGLQVDNGGTVTRLVAAVDASLATLEQDQGPGQVLYLVHHGLFWDGNIPLTGRRYRRVRALLDHDAALYAAHIPLDVHPEVGNNVQLAVRLGLAVAGWFGNYRGIQLGVEARPAEPDGLPRDHLVVILKEALALAPHACMLVPGGPDSARRIGIVTGAGGSMLSQAREAGLDTLITGEGPAHTYHDAMEWGLNLIYAGHYATETLGVQALASHLEQRFGLPWQFSHQPTGL